MKHSRWFKVTFSSPSWRSLNLWRGALNHPKKVKKNCQVVTNQIWDASYTSQDAVVAYWRFFWGSTNLKKMSSKAPGGHCELTMGRKFEKKNTHLEQTKTTYTPEHSPWKMMVGRRSFPIGKVYYQGRTVKLPGGNLPILHHSSISMPTRLCITSIYHSLVHL